MQSADVTEHWIKTESYDKQLVITAKLNSVQNKIKT